MNIYEKLAAITAELETVAKNLVVPTSGKKSYKAVSEGDVLAAVKPLEKKYGVYSFPIERSVIDSDVIITSAEYNGKMQERKQVFLRVATTYRFVNVEDPTEFVDVPTYGDGVDSQDKAPGKAMTYADKYALLKAYKIQTGEDPDKDPSGELVSKGTPGMATDKQISYIKKLYQDTQNDADKQAWLREHGYLTANGYQISGLTLSQANEIIEALKYGN